MPKAANMGVMTWDKELARIAQRWALQCHYGHDDCRGLPNMRVGQNVGFSGSSNPKSPNMTKIAVMWYEKEVGLYSAGGVSSFQYSMNTGHFTQWIWATSYKLGCGYIGYKKGIMYSHFLVCNYGPAGNVLRRPIYQQGSPCSGCPEGTTCGGDSRYPNLCKADGDEVPTGDGSFSFGDGFPSGSVSQHSRVLLRLCSALVASGIVLLMLL